MTQRISHFFCLLFILFGGVTYAFSTGAQTTLQPSTAEDIAIAFYKTGNVVPNFKSWIEGQEPYRSTPLGRRPKIMAEEISRLSQKYKNFEAQENLITIKTSAVLNTVKLQNKGSQNDYILNIKLSDANDVLYFPYQFLNQNIMVIPNNFKTAKSHIITEGQFSHIQSLIKDNERQTLIIKLQADKSDFKHPYMVDKLPQWSFKTNIASMEAWADNGTLLWEYTAPWHLSPQQQKMQKLYKKRSNQLNKSGIQKSLTDLY